VYTVLLILHLVSAIAVIAVVLLQAGKGGGLSGAFGSGMGSETLFGSRTGDVLTRGTAIVATFFIVSSLALAYLSAKTGSTVAKDIRQQQRDEKGAAEKLRQLQELLKSKAAEDATKTDVVKPDGEPTTDVRPPLDPNLFQRRKTLPLVPADAE